MSLRQRLAALLLCLRDPQKVASFQRLCGVEEPRRPAGAPEETGGSDPERAAIPEGGGSKLRACGARNGVRNGLPEATATATAGELESHKTLQNRVPGLRRNSLTGEEGEAYGVRNWPLFYLFSLGTELGNELFYITFFPFWIWNLDALVGRRLVIMWVLVMYLGQCAKDVIRWPRPASPPVVKLEVFYNSEYSMPSTHAMSGTAIPLTLVLLTYGRWQDIIAGFLYAIFILAVFYPYVELIDNFNQIYKYSPLIIISLHLALGIFSFTLDTWSTSRGDTAEILGSGAGIACGSHVAYHIGLTSEPPLDTLPLTIPSITVTHFGKVMLRILIGMVFLMLMRIVMKKITIPLACKVFGIKSDDVRKARQYMEVELTYRYITYGMVGFSITFLVPCLFFFIGLS
ncbi:sphingosine-1-phosphate phosphatase 1 isoform X2 [Notamacropus eugenii]|uniref:sphingosine-1-phosphate phosphatase 1 isoform X2 n=1 Tax=Notamacropus eugenii TaxID=9315 RepID=UPI003B66C984